MSKINGVGILFGFLIFLFSSPFNVYATADTVKEMFENGDSPTEQKGPDEPEINLNPDEGEESLSGNENIDNGSLVFDLIKMVFALFLILALIYILLKVLNKRNKMFNKVKALENLGGISVGPSKSIQIVRVGKKLYLVGVGENVQLLEEIQEEEMKEEILSNFQEQSEFKTENILSLFQRKNSQKTVETDNRGNDFKHLFSNELEKLKQNRKSLINKHAEKEDNHE